MSEFIQALNDVFEDFGPVNCRRMFGGYGVYHDKLMFALVTDDRLYFKTDAQLASELKARGMVPFEYDRQGKRVQLAYYLAPDDIYDDREAAAFWAKKAFAVALIAAKNKQRNIER